MGRLIRLIATMPSTPRGAVAMVTFFALASSWLNWGFSLIFSAVLAREVARRVDGVDLSRARRRELSRHRQHLGAGA
jgi:short-chain fatty acids transporter